MKLIWIHGYMIALMHCQSIASNTLSLNEVSIISS